MVRCLLLSASLVMAAGGCAASAPSKGNYSRIQLPSASAERAFDLASAALENEFQFVLLEADSGRGVLTTQAKESRETDTALATISPLRGPERFRRRAEIRVSPAANGTDVYCRVVLEKLDSESRRLFTHDTDHADSVGGTPIDRGEASGLEQDVDWTYVRRDRNLERRILQSLTDTGSGT